MPRIESRSLVWAFAASVGFLAVLGQGQNASAYSSYRGLWEARENDQGRILQRYDHLFSVNLDQDLSDRLASRENVNYGYRWEQEVGKQETVSPGASLAMNGDFFLANLAVNSVRDLNSQSVQPNSDTVGFTWSSRWQKSLVPELRFNYDYARYKTDSSDRKLDEGQKSIGGEMNWDLRLVQALYSYRRNESTYGNYQTIQDNQVARINASRAWLDNRLQVSVGHEYNESRNENQTSYDPTTGTAIRPVGLYSAFTGIESSPANPIFDPPLSNTPALLDTVVNVSAYPVPVPNPNSNYCIRLQKNQISSAAQSVDRIYLYTDVNLGANPAGFLFSLYTSDDPLLASPWSVVNVTSSYDVINSRFIVYVPTINALYLKVVVQHPNGVAVNFSEVKAEQITHSTAGTTTTEMSKNRSNRSDFNLDFKLNNTVAFYYNFLMARDDTDSKTMNENQTHNAGTRLQNAAGDLRSNLSYSLSKRRYREGPEAQTQTYLVDINKVLLPTLTVSLGGSHESSSQGGVAISDMNRYTFYTDAKLYPDLTSRFEAVYWAQETFHQGLESTFLDDLREQFTLTSRFLPSLVVSFIDIYEVQNQNKKLFDKKNTSSLTGSWQLSEYCSLNGTIQREDSLRADDAYSYSLGMVVGLGAGLEFKANYTLQDSVSITQSGNASLRWSAHQNLSWEVGCDYAESDAATLQNVYKVYSKLLVSFATR